MRFFLASVLILLSPLTALACSCASRGQPCEAAWIVDSVFAGTVTNVWTIPPNSVYVRFRITEHFRGLDKEQRTIWITTPIGEAACGIPFKRGEAYLVYGWKARSGLASLHTNICSRTWPLKYAQADLEYLRSIDQQPTTTRIYGNVKEYTFDEDFVPKAEVSIMDHYSPPEGDVYSMAPLANLQVDISPVDGTPRQPTALHTTTNASGEFELTNLPAGTYLVSVPTPKGLTAMHSKQVKAYSKGCGWSAFRTTADGRISGSLVGPDNKPISGVMVYLVRSKEGEGAEEPFRFEMTDAYGKFTFAPVPAGRFLLGVNIAKSIWIEENRRFRRTYYPGVEKAKQAKVISLGVGEKLDSLVLHLARAR